MRTHSRVRRERDRREQEQPKTSKVDESLAAEHTHDTGLNGHSLGSLSIVPGIHQTSNEAPIGAEGGAIGDGVARRVQAATEGGTPLSSGVQSRMERGFGADFSDVRIHTDRESWRLNQELGARAFTVGSDVFFGRGTDGDDRTMAHELSHVLQQRSLPATSGLNVGADDDPMEREAASFAHAVTSGSRLDLSSPSSAASQAGAMIQRDRGSDDYKQGYEDGKSGGEARPVPRDGDALIDYQEGYAQGHYDFQQNTDGPNQSTAPIPSGPKSDPNAPTSFPGDTDDPDKLSDGEETAVEWAKRVILVGGGEAIGHLIGGPAGPIGHLIDLATDPGGDTKLPHLIYQAVDAEMEVPCPGAAWHLKRENAESDAREYEERTGQKAIVEEQYTKDDTGVDE
ncbi:MAG TPA: DUF4157 domain-containing protein [Vicinamibacterales bacterium]|nr:DUF4157 domain-containing protein [Vicinamibacterales bacterium]